MTCTIEFIELGVLHRQKRSIITSRLIIIAKLIKIATKIEASSLTITMTSPTNYFEKQKFLIIRQGSNLAA